MYLSVKQKVDNQTFGSGIQMKLGLTPLKKLTLDVQCFSKSL